MSFAFNASNIENSNDLLINNKEKINNINQLLNGNVIKENKDYLNSFYKGQLKDIVTDDSISVKLNNLLEILESNKEIRSDQKMEEIINNMFSVAKILRFE